MGIEASGLDNLITASYDLLGLISFLTDGKKECRAWTIRKGTKAPQAAGKIHSDFERGFIRASVIGYDDLEANNFDYAAVKAKVCSAPRARSMLCTMATSSSSCLMFKGVHHDLWYYGRYAR